MLLLSDSEKSAIVRGEPFMLYRLPGESRVHTIIGGYVRDRSLHFGNVAVSLWTGIKDMDGAEVIPSQSTSKDYYIDSLSDLIGRLRLDGHKTVISRIIRGEVVHDDIISLVTDFFSGEAVTGTFDFVFYHQAVAGWLGRSPELLLERMEENQLRTRALAGTRPLTESGCHWSEKNIREHRYVTDDIARRLNRLGLIFEVGCPGSFAYGTVEHLLTPVTIKTRSYDSFLRIASELHPTPAVAGLPREKSIGEIAEYELVPRIFYGGDINVDNKVDYVVLRCAHFDSVHWAVYTGSGITPDSDPEEEWLETERKAAPLVDFFSHTFISGNK